MNSIGIQKYFGNQPATPIRSTGEGDNKITLWRAADGKEAIETNGDPILDTDSDWREALEMLA